MRTLGPYKYRFGYWRKLSDGQKTFCSAGIRAIFGSLNKDNSYECRFYEQRPRTKVVEVEFKLEKFAAGPFGGLCPIMSPIDRLNLCWRVVGRKNWNRYYSPPAELTKAIGLSHHVLHKKVFMRVIKK